MDRGSTSAELRWIYGVTQVAHDWSDLAAAAERASNLSLYVEIGPYVLEINEVIEDRL